MLVFSHQTIGKCLCSTDVVVIQANSISLATFGDNKIVFHIYFLINSLFSITVYFIVTQTENIAHLNALRKVEHYFRFYFNLLYFQVDFLLLIRKFQSRVWVGGHYTYPLSHYMSQIVYSIRGSKEEIGRCEITNIGHKSMILKTKS